MPDLDRALAAATAAVDAAGQLLGAGQVDDLRAELDAVRARHGFRGDTVVAALVGGTGSGKSSLLNALADREVVDTGVLRPTTEYPLAWTPRAGGAALQRLLDGLDVTHRVVHDLAVDVAVLDLPDLDSVETTHRATVDRLLPRIDLVLWVLDPQKYNDLQIHGLIRRRTGWADQLLFVLNQVDRLDEPDRRAVRHDLITTLRADGLAAPTVVLTAASPGAGRPWGIDDLWHELRARVADKRLVVDKLVRDLAGIGEEIGRRSGHDADPGIDVVARWDELRHVTADLAASAAIDATVVAGTERLGARTAAAAGSGPAGRLWHALRSSTAGRVLGAPQDTAPATAGPATSGTGPLERAAHRLGREVVDLSTTVGGALGRRLRRELTPDTLDDALRAAARAATDARPPEVPVRPAWRAAAVLQTLLTAAVVVGAVWTWSDPGAVGPGDVPWPLVLAVGGLLAAVLVRRLLRSSGAAAGRAAALRRRERVARDVDEGLQRRVGAPLQALLITRSRIVEALGDLDAHLS